MTALLLAVYAALLVGGGLLVSRRVHSAGDFFVAGRALPSGLVFATLLAANIGAGSTVGATGLGYRLGLSAWWWSGSAALGCAVLGWGVVPRLYARAQREGFLTVGDFLEARYDRSVRVLLAAVLWLGTLSILAGQLIAMAWALQAMLGLPKAWGCLLAGAVLAAYVAGGGLLASAWVNLAQLATLLLGFLLALPFTWQLAGGWGGLAAAAGPARQAQYASPFGMGLDGILGLVVIFVPAFAISPGLIQKTFGARSAREARFAVLANALVLVLFAFVPPLLGMAVRALRPGLENSELALPVLMTELLPPWLGALGLLALFAAEVSTADAVLFMLSTSLSRDLYQRLLRPAASDAQLLRVARATSIVAGAIGIGLAILLPSVAAALKAFYGVMTVSLCVPLLWGLWRRDGSAVQARIAVVGAILAALGVLWWLGDAPSAVWAPFVAGTALALAVFGLGRTRAA